MQNTNQAQQQPPTTSPCSTVDMLRERAASAYADLNAEHTILVDFEHVYEVSAEFAAVLLPELDDQKIKIVGLLPS